MARINRTDITPRNNHHRRNNRPRGSNRPPVTRPWTADEEALFLGFEVSHIPGTRWPIEAMDFFSRKHEMDCRRWTLESLDPKILEEREKVEKETRLKKVWDPCRISGSREDRAQVRYPYTAEEEALYSEFKAFYVPGTRWPIQDMNQATRTRRLDCRKWTQRSLSLKFLEERERNSEETEVSIAQDIPEEEESANEEGGPYGGEDSGNGGGSERGWISEEDESSRKRSSSI
jgi:hypothetical protein